MSAVGSHYPVWGFCKIFHQRKREGDECKRLCEEQPSAALNKTAGSCSLVSVIFHITTCLGLIISSQEIAQVLRQIKCSEGTVEWKSVLIMGADGSEPVAIPKPFFAQPIFHNSLYSDLQELC